MEPRTFGVQLEYELCTGHYKRYFVMKFFPGQYHISKVRELQLIYWLRNNKSLSLNNITNKRNLNIVLYCLNRSSRCIWLATLLFMNRFSISHCDQIYDNSILAGLPQSSNRTTKDSLEINSILKRYNKIQWHNKMSTTDSWPIHYSSTIFPLKDQTGIPTNSSTITSK